MRASAIAESSIIQLLSPKSHDAVVVTIRDDRIELCAGNITTPATTCAISRLTPQKIVIANRSNFRMLARGGDPVNKALHLAAGSCLEALAKQVRGRSTVRVQRNGTLLPLFVIPRGWAGGNGENDTGFGQCR